MVDSFDFSKWAVVSHKDDSGLGRLATDLRSILGLGYRIVAPSNRIEGHPLEGPRERLLDPAFSDDELGSTLSGLEGIIFPECVNRWHPRLYAIGKSLGLKIVCIPMWEWFQGRDQEWRDCDLLVCHSQWTENIVRSYGWQKTVRIPPTVDLSQFPKRAIEGPARLFVHNAGIVNPDDRKGTRDSILAFRKVKRKDITLIVRMQNKVPLPQLDRRIEVIVDNLAQPGDLYSTGDVAIQPSKLEGLGLMVIEPLSCGIPVITTDYPPMNEYVQSKEMLVRKRWFKRKGFPTNWVKHAHLRLPDVNDIARKIEWCASNDLAEISKINREFAQANLMPEHLKQSWSEALSNL